MAEVRLRTLDFEEAMRWFSERYPDVLPAALIGSENFMRLFLEHGKRAFWISGVNSADVLRDVRDELARAIQEGISRQEFVRTMSDRLAGQYDDMKDHEIPPWRLELIYRNHLQTSYNAGRYRAMIENAGRRPWFMYDAVIDSRTRDDHAAMDGKIFAWDDPIWETWWPPNGHNCRCSVRALTESEMVERGLAPLDSREMDFPPPDEGWDYNPARLLWGAELEGLDPAGRKIAGADLDRLRSDDGFIDMLKTLDAEKYDWLLTVARGLGLL
jgi:SPP1 gp7 family putative phage head morphogenesis protein